MFSVAVGDRCTMYHHAGMQAFMEVAIARTCVLTEYPENPAVAISEAPKESLAQSNSRGSDQVLSLSLSEPH